MSKAKPSAGFESASTKTYKPHYKTINMPKKAKPKRVTRARSWRVARRKRKVKLLAQGKSRNRKKRPKNKNKKQST
tara:strand:- start:1770 stop:1997 length:228 start_codon:yes stop_codon:yes gene_type:complete